LLDVLWSLPATDLLPLKLAAGTQGGVCSSTQHYLQQLPPDTHDTATSAKELVALPPAAYPPWLAVLLDEVVKPQRLAAMNGRQLVGLLVTLAQVGYYLWSYGWVKGSIKIKSACLMLNRRVIA